MNAAEASALLLVYADALDDIERTRIATANRAWALANAKGMAGTPEANRLQAMSDALSAIERDATLQLKRALRLHPLHPWIKATAGIGEKQGARLLAAIGDPADRSTYAQLWAYCGYHVLPVDLGGTRSSDPGHTPSVADHGIPAGVAPTHRRGHRSNWNATAKKRTHLIAASCIKFTDSPYRATYEEGRRKYANAAHVVACRRCGPAGAPAEPGTPLNAGHQHARALRLVAKAILRDLWTEAQRIRAEPVGPDIRSKQPYVKHGRPPSTPGPT